MKLYRVRLAAAERRTETGGLARVQAVVYAVASDRMQVPALVDALVPEWRGASIEVLDELPTDRVWRSVRIGYSDPRLFLLVDGNTAEEVRARLLDIVPADSAYREYVVAGVYEIGGVVDTSRAGVV